MPFEIRTCVVCQQPAGPGHQCPRRLISRLHRLESRALDHDEEQPPEPERTYADRLHEGFSLANRNNW